MTKSIALDDALEARVRIIAAERNISAESIVANAIREYVEREEARETFAREALESFEDYQATGLHLTVGEVQAWLKGWGTKDESDPPECHG